MLAAFGFFGIAIAHGPTKTPFSLWITTGLGLSVIGDLCLLSRKIGRVFVVGIAAFLLAHIAYIVAFFHVGIDWVGAAASLLILLPLAITVHRWLRPDVPAALQRPVLAYLVVITTMVACAAGVWAQHHAIFSLLPTAILFMASDIGVAMQRFKQGRFGTQLWAIPAYFAAQLLFAAHVLLPL